MKKLFIVALFICLMVGIGWAATPGTCTSANTEMGPGYEMLTVTCTGGSAGAFPSTTLTIRPGYVTRIVTDPGTPAPQDDYDISLVDSHSLSIATLTNRDEANTEEVIPTAKFIDGTMTMAITNNNVASAGIVIYIYSVR